MATEDAMEHSRETRHLLNNHIQVTQIKLDNLEKSGQERHDTLVQAADARAAVTAASIGRLENALKWAGGLIVSLVLTVLGWAVLQQINTNESQKKELAQQIKLLQDQRNAAAQREQIMQQLESASGASEPAGASNGVRKN